MAASPSAASATQDAVITSDTLSSDASTAGFAAPGDVVSAMKDVQLGGIDKEAEAAAKRQIEEQEASRRAEQEKKALNSYMQLIQAFLDVADDVEALGAKIKEDYYRCDFQFLNVCKEQANTAADATVRGKLQRIIDGVAAEASNKLTEASEKVGKVLQAGSPGLMETAMASLVKQGGVDEAVLNLLDANIVSAEQAGAKDAVEVLTRVKNRAFLELDKFKSPEQRLMSKLLRTDSPEQRKDMLSKAFTPVEKLVLGAGEEKEEPMPEVTPPDFIELTKTMIRNFGNLGMSHEENLEDRLMQIAREAEEMSTSIYGAAMTAREQQDRAWTEGSVSVWDLEMLEQQAEIQGEQMPWHGDVDEQKFLDAMQGACSARCGVPPPTPHVAFTCANIPKCSCRCASARCFHWWQVSERTGRSRLEGNRMSARCDVREPSSRWMRGRQTSSCQCMFASACRTRTSAHRSSSSPSATSHMLALIEHNPTHTPTMQPQCELR